MLWKTATINNSSVYPGISVSEISTNGILPKDPDIEFSASMDENKAYH